MPISPSFAALKFWQTYRYDFNANLKLAWPIILGQLGQVSVNIIDNIMVGQLGAIALAAVSLGVSVFVVFFVVGMGLSMALQPLVAEADGRGDAQGCSYSFKHSFVINTLFSLLSILIIECTFHLVFNLGQDPEVAALSIPYMRLCVYSLLPMLFYQSLRGLCEGLSSSTPPMIAMLIGNAVNVILNYMFIFGNWGAPALGVTGAAIGTLVSRIVMFAVLLVLMRYWKSKSELSLWSYLKRVNPKTYSKRFFRKVLRLGVPSSLQMFFEVGAFAGAAIMMGMIGAKEMAAHQITINAITTTFMICVGLSVAATVRVGNALGRKDKVGMRRAGQVTLMQVLLFMSCSALIIAALRFVIPTWYIDDVEVISIAATLFLISAIFQLSDGVQVAAIGALRGLQDIWWPTGITFFAYIIIGMPFSYLSAFVWDLGYIGIWVGLLLGLSLSAVLNTMRFFRLTRV